MNTPKHAFIGLLAFALVAPAALSAGAESKPEPLISAPLGLALMSPLDTSPGGFRVVQHAQLHILYGENYALSGVALGPGVNRSEDYAYGLQLAGFVNLAGGHVSGVQLSGFYNRAGRDLDGLQLGVVNQASRLNSGLQFGVTSIAGEADGMQWSVVTIANDLRGLQLAVVTTADDVAGAQIGCVDIAAGVTGTQIGFVNVAGEVTGVQIGLVNVSSHNKFGQFGIVNVDSTNWFRLYAAAGSDHHSALGVKTGSQWFFGDVGLSPHGEDDGHFSRKVSVLAGFGIWHKVSLFNASLQFNRQATEQGNHPYSFPAALALPVGGGAELIASGGPSLDHDFRYKQMEWSLGFQVRFKEQTLLPENGG